MVSGVSVQVSGAMKIQRTDDKEQSVSVSCHLTSVIYYLTPETRHLTPKIKPYFVNYLRDTRLISYALTQSGLSVEIGLFYVINGQPQAVLFFNFLSDRSGAVIIPWP